MGLLDGYVGDDTVKDEFGQTQADRRQPVFAGLIKAGLLAMAGGGNLMPEDRAKYLAQAGGAVADIPTDMAKFRSEAAQQALRGQQIKTQQQTLQDSQQIHAYVNDPAFKAALASLPPARQALAMGAALKGDFATVDKVLEGQRWKTDQRGNFLGPNGEILDAYGKPIIGADGKPVFRGAGAGAFDASSESVGGIDRLNLTPLQDVPHEIAIQALQVARGEMAPPTVRTNPNAAQINQLAAQVAGPNGTSYKVRQDFEHSITSGGTTDKLVIGPWSKMMQHGAAAQKAYDELQHTDGGKWAGVIDKVLMGTATATDPKVLRLVEEFKVEMRNYVDEGQKLIVGGALPVEAMHEVAGLNDPTRPPAAQLGTMHAFANMTKPVMDQLLANGRRVRHNGALTLADLGINPESLAAREYLEKRFREGPGTSTPTPPQPADPNAPKPGFYPDADGVWRNH